MLKVGLTGGIGSGKTTVSDCFQKLGVPVVDTDVIARRLVAPGSPALFQIVEAFGKSVLTSDGELDRKALGARVFSNPSLKARLESILHPKIKQETLDRVGRIDAPYCVIVVPLLLETDFDELVDRVLVVDAPEDRRMGWVAARDDLPESTIRKIMASQTSREERLAAADYVIDNDGSIEELEDKVVSLNRVILSELG